MKHFNLDFNWKFSYSTGNSFKDKLGKAYKETVNLPHDFSIKLDRSESERSNAAGGFFPGGIGTYEREMVIHNDEKEKVFILLVEGAFMNTEVYLNGHLAAVHPYGYTEFKVDLTPYIRFGENNKIRIVVNNNALPNSRWYTGSGLYRHVQLLIAEKLYIDPWDLSVTTKDIGTTKALINIEAAVTNILSTNQTIEWETTIYDQNGREIVTKVKNAIAHKEGKTTLQIQIPIEAPKLWSIESPNLYKAVTRIYQDESLLDEMESTFGIRSISFDSKNGFCLNGTPIKLQGGCIHHDNGPLGAAAFNVAEYRKIRLLKELGYNAIRTAHNPPSRALLDACDYYGMLVIDEMFDCWRQKKNSYDYHLYFEDWWKRDIESTIFRDRNHPSIIMWSIGNEIGERDGNSNGVQISEKLCGYVKQLDPTRAVTNGVNAIFLDAGEFGGILANIFNGSAGDISELPTEVHELLKECDRVTSEWGDITEPFCKPLDVVGYNYLDSRYEEDGIKFPDRLICGTESYPKMMAAVWKKVKENPHVIGDFTWTAIDYIGESGIGRSFYNQTGNLFGDYPWHLSNCGDLDICGFIRPQGEYRKILWNMRKEPYLAILKPEHFGKKEIVSAWGWSDVVHSWSFPENVGQMVRVDIYSNADEVELLINGRSFGKKIVDDELKVSFDVNYTAGLIEAINYRNGMKAETDRIETSGEPYQIHLEVETENWGSANTEELKYITCSIVDHNGKLVPYAEHVVNVEVSGVGELAGIGTGDPVSEESYMELYRKAYNGKLLIVVRGKGEGETIVSARADGIGEYFIELKMSGLKESFSGRSYEKASC
ncbi:glycoside hydrolase family 2 TIM barrel-domain containing protein [Neobacillus sp. 3P2-tot-E-2]|uniref:glycoside hydrolase family 2 TIM barrel-domain containing protein n=1 Tax=Neobacillus sp. 3P2-tot-E-2 TaxID=3132212 RepID=UPI0039A2328D